MKYRIHTFITLFWIFYYASAQGGWQNATYIPEIKSLQVIANGNFTEIPVIRLHSDQFITIGFDELAEDMSWISYRIIHCDANWQPDRISEMEFLNGFNQTAIEDAQPSFNTFTPYYHYQITLPAERFRISGNYAVLFYKDEQPDKTIASACFSVSERTTEIIAELTTITDLGFNDEYQQLNIRLRWKNQFPANPADELKLVVSQNNRRDNEVVITHPTRFSANEAFYEHNRSLIFEAGNNYRRFEIVNHKYAGIGVEKIRFFEPLYHVLLTPGTVKANMPYFYDQDQNGRYVIRQSEAENNDLEADYFMVHFALENDNPFIEGAIYLDGDFTNNRFDESNKMIYNFESRRYEQAMLLKQGHYNYQYLFVPNQSRKGSPRLIEGNFHETGNEYLIKVYYRPPGQYYDRLTGTALVKKD